MNKARGYADTQRVDVLGVHLAVDKRNVPNFTSEPFLLAAFELGTIDDTFAKLTRDMYRAQERRWETTKELTAASEDSLDRAPWFVYFSVAYQGRTWQCPKHSGKPSTNNCGFSTKAAVGWAALFGDSYSKLLEDKARSLVSPDGYIGDAYPGGKRNTSLNINTNALILEAMLFRQRGRHAFLETKNEYSRPRDLETVRPFIQAASVARSVTGRRPSEHPAVLRGSGSIRHCEVRNRQDERLS
jgi:hypothetical protein